MVICYLTLIVFSIEKKYFGGGKIIFLQEIKKLERRRSTHENKHEWRSYYYHITQTFFSTSQINH